MKRNFKMKKYQLSFLFLLSFPVCFGQQPTYNNLVFEGAGIRGIAYSGVLTELDRLGITDSIKNVGGTSAGALTALAFSIGYTPDEITEIVFNTRFNRLNDGRFLFFGGFYRLFHFFGWYRGNALTKFVEDIIIHKNMNPDITFRQMHDADYINLFVTGTSLNNQKLIVFSYQTYPEMKVKDAVRISMSIPFYFKPVLIDSTGKVICKPENKSYYDLMVDGGFIANFPIFIFDSTCIIDNQMKRIENIKTLGIRIDSESQIDLDKSSGGLSMVEINTLVDYINAFYLFVLENLNRQQLTKKDWERTISVCSSGIGPKVRKLSLKEKEILINSGKAGVNDYFSQLK
jgi:NTE family protein